MTSRRTTAIECVTRVASHREDVEGPDADPMLYSISQPNIASLLVWDIPVEMSTWMEVVAHLP